MNKRKREKEQGEMAKVNGQRFIKSFVKMRIHPQHLNAAIVKHIEQKLKEKLEKRWTERYGYIESVEMMPLVNAGIVDAKSGFAEFNIYYKARACKPFAGQCLTARVSNTTKLGVHFEAGPLQLFMHEKMIPASYIYADGTYKCQRSGETLQRGDERRVKIVGTSWTDNCYVSVLFFLNPF